MAKLTMIAGGHYMLTYTENGVDDNHNTPYMKYKVYPVIHWLGSNYAIMIPFFNGELIGPSKITSSQLKEICQQFKVEYPDNNPNNIEYEWYDYPTKGYISLTNTEISITLPCKDKDDIPQRYKITQISALDAYGLVYDGNLTKGNNFENGIVLFNLDNLSN